MNQQPIKKIAELKALDRVSRPVADRVRRVTRNDAIENALSGTWFGHSLHPTLTDIPIGAWTMATALDLTTGRAGAAGARRLVGLGVLTVLPTAACGISDWSVYRPAQRVGLVHGAANLTAAALQGVSWVARRRGRRLTGVALSGLGLGITLSAAYLGGHLTLVQGVGVDHTAFERPISDWTDVAALSALPDGKPVRVTPGGVPVMLVRRDDTVHALSAHCVHAGASLDEGILVRDDRIRCPLHGSVFRLADGKAVRGPAPYDQPSWEVRVDDDRVYVRS